MKDTQTAWRWLRRERPYLLKLLLEDDMPAGIDEAVAEAMTEFYLYMKQREEGK